MCESDKERDDKRWIIFGCALRVKRDKGGDVWDAGADKKTGD